MDAGNSVIAMNHMFIPAHIIKIFYLQTGPFLLNNTILKIILLIRTLLKVFGDIYIFI
jgi:hypothetical protein